MFYCVQTLTPFKANKQNSFTQKCSCFSTLQNLSHKVQEIIELQITIFKLIQFMLRKILRVAKQQSAGRLFKKNLFNFYNEVPKFDPSKDYYQILEVTKDSSDSDIKKSYYRLAKTYHPDSNPGQQAKFKEINEAYSVLSDNNLRKQYNSARSFQGFSRRMGRKAREGNYSYEEYRTMYSNLSPQEQAEILEQTKKKMRIVLYFGVAMLIILPFLTRRNHRYFIVDNGELVPVEFEGGMYGGMAPPPGVVGPYGQAPYPGQGPYPAQPQQGYYAPPPPYGIHANQTPPGYQQPPPGYQQPPSSYQQPYPPSGNGQYGNYRLQQPPQ